VDQTGRPRRLTPAALLRRLPEAELEPEDDDPTQEMRRVELRRSVFTIGGLDHVSEITLVNAVVDAVRSAEKVRES
jgi:hypothetical protein